MTRQTKGVQTPETLHNASRELIEIGGSLASLAEQMGALGMADGVEATNYRSLIDGMKFLRNFHAAVKSAIIEERDRRGDFRRA